MAGIFFLIKVLLLHALILKITYCIFNGNALIVMGLMYKQCPSPLDTGAFLYSAAFQNKGKL